MASMVCVDTATGSLTRYETGGQCVRKTHHAVPESGASQLTKHMIEMFRVWPDPEFSVDPPPRPTNPPTSFGRNRVPIAA